MNISYNVVQEGIDYIVDGVTATIVTKVPIDNGPRFHKHFFASRQEWLEGV